MNTNKMIDILIDSRHIHMVYTKEANEVEECCVCISTEWFQHLMTFKCLKSSVDQALEAIQNAMEDDRGSIQLDIDEKGNASYTYI